MRRALFVLIILLLSSPAHADFRNQFALLGTAELTGTNDAQEKQYADIANQWGYEVVLGDPWGSSKANTAVNAGLKVLLSSNGDRAAKWYRFNNPTGEPTRINIGIGDEIIKTEMYTELETALCMTVDGPNMASNDLYNPNNPGTNKWKYRPDQTSSTTQIFTANHRDFAGIAQNVTANLRVRSLQQQQQNGKQLFHGLYFDEITFPSHTPTLQCYNPINGNPGDFNNWDDGRKEFIEQLKVAAIAAINAQAPNSYIGTSGNSWKMAEYSDEWQGQGADVAMDLLYSESSGGKQECELFAKLEAAPATGCGTQNTANASLWGTVPFSMAAVQIIPTSVGALGDFPEFQRSYRAGQLIAGRAAHQTDATGKGIWFGWFGAVYLPPSNNAVQLLRTIPNWDNMVNATGRSWTEASDIYTSTNSFINDKIAYSWHWRDKKKLFVVRNNQSGGNPTITVPANKTLLEIRLTDNYGVETGATCAIGTCFTRTNTTTITPTTSTAAVNGVPVDKLFVLVFSSNPTFQPPARVDVINQLDVCWAVTDGKAMLPANDSTGWAVTVAGVGKTPTSTSRQGNTCFRLVFDTGTITLGSQAVTVAYTPGNITDGSLAPATAFTAQTADNNLPGGIAASVQTQTRSQFRHFEGDEIIAADMKYGTENGTMSVVLGGTFRARLKVANTVAAANNISFPLFYDRNDSNFLRVTNSCATSPVILIDAPQFPTGEPTTEQLLSSHTTDVACQIVESAGGEPTLTLPLNSETECEYALKVCTDATLGAMRFRVHDTGGEALDAYSVTPTATVVTGFNERHGMSVGGGNW